MGSTSSRARRGTLAGTIVDGHELVRVLAAGGMGEVYLARNLRLGVQRAIKVIHSSLRTDPVAAERFAREARVLARLQHNSIIQIVEFGELSNGWPYFVMEYVEGPSLDEVITSLGSMRLADALIVLEQIANALAYAHRIGVIHRDLKPANVLLRGGEVRQVKVIDFGLARALSEDAISRLTTEGQMLGSPLYVAPEQCTGNGDITAAADVYALAGVAYTLLSGKPVFPRNSPLSSVAAHTSEQAPRLSERCPDIPDMLDDLLFACLTKEPHLRPSTDEVVAHLARLARKLESEEDMDDTASGMDDTVRAPGAELHEHTSEVARTLKNPPEHGLKNTLVNQTIGLVLELAGALSAHDPGLAQARDELTRANGVIDELEMELAMLTSRIEELPIAERSQLAHERHALVQRVATLREQAVDNQSRLAARVDGMRAGADPAARKLFGELDDVLAQLRATTK